MTLQGYNCSIYFKPIVSQGFNNHNVSKDLSKYYMALLKAFASVSEVMKAIGKGFFSRTKASKKIGSSS